MTYLPELEDALLKAAERKQVQLTLERPSRSWSTRRGGTSLTFAVLLVLGCTGGAMAAAGVFAVGAPVRPANRATALTGEGLPLPGGSRLLPLRASDPAGGPPWGVLVSRTTRARSCVSVGRVNDGTIGVVGMDGAFGNDGHFHPISSEQQSDSACGRTDGRGHAFVNAKLQDVPVSGLLGIGPTTTAGCRPQGGTSFSEGDCPPADLREISYGLLGPDAISLTYELPFHHLHKLSKLGPGGSYLIVQAQRAPYEGNTSGPGLSSGVIRSVTYTDGHTCHVAFGSLFESCPPVGFLEAHRNMPPASKLASTVHVRIEPAHRYCIQIQAPGEQRMLPCAKGTPSGFTPITPKVPSVLAVLSFRSPVKIDDASSHYEIRANYPHNPSCPDQGTAAPTDMNFSAGQEMVRYIIIPTSCHGLAYATVTYVLTRGPAGSTPNIESNSSQARLVAKFSFALP